MSEQDKLNVETLLKFYESARQEILSRIASRDNSLLLYLGGVGVIIAAAFQKDSAKLYLAIIPYLAAGVAPIIAHHHSMIGALSAYCSIELGKQFHNYGIRAPQWDSSKSRMDFVNKTIKMRYLGDIALVVMPAAMGVILSFGEGTTTGTRNFVIYLIAVLLLILALILMLSSFRRRRILFEKMRSENQKEEEPNK